MIALNLVLLTAAVLTLHEPFPPIVAPVVPVVARMRPVSDIARSIVDEATRRSPTVARLIQELADFDVIVYVELRMGYMSDRGTTSLMTVAGNWRMVRVGISDRLSPAERIQILGHELQHVLEIAQEAKVRDDVSFRALFDRIGYGMSEKSFETDRAREVELTIRGELAKGKA